MSRTILLGLAALASVVISTPSQATPIALELALLLNTSATFSPTQFGILKTSHVNALTELLPQDGSVAIEVINIKAGQLTVEFPEAIITAANFAALTAAISGMTRVAGSSAVGDAITEAATDLSTVAIDGLRKIIDVSPDVPSYQGEDPDTAADNAVAAGIDQVNCVTPFGGIAGACGFIAGTDSFSFNVSFAEFESAVTTKLAREIGVPEPPTLLLLSAGLIGVGIAARRLSKA